MSDAKMSLRDGVPPVYGERSIFNQEIRPWMHSRVDAERRGALRTQSSKMTGTAGADAAVIKISRVRMFRSRLQFIKKGWRNKSGSKSKYFHQRRLALFFSLFHSLTLC